MWQRRVEERFVSFQPTQGRRDDDFVVGVLLPFVRINDHPRAIIILTGRDCRDHCSKLNLRLLNRRLRDSIQYLRIRFRHERVLALDALLQPEELETLPVHRTPDKRAPHFGFLDEHGLLALGLCGRQIVELRCSFRFHKVHETHAGRDGRRVVTAVLEGVGDDAPK